MKSFGTIINSLKERSNIQRQGEPVLFCRSSISTVSHRLCSYSEAKQYQIQLFLIFTSNPLLKHNSIRTEE